MKGHQFVIVPAGLMAVLLCGATWPVDPAQAQDVEAPLFEVDPFWPKPLPNNWILGMTVGVTVDARDHVFVIHRPNVFFDPRTEIGAATEPKTGECCVPAPDVLEFDPNGNLVNHWGGPGDGYTWPAFNHGITADDEGNLWLGGNGQTDSHILKFTRDGRFLQQFGEPGLPLDSLSHDHFAGVAEVAIDADANEAYIADGYRNRRVAVIDADTGEIKRFWGAYGNEPEDEDLGPYDPDAMPAQQFRNPVHCIQISNDGLVYVCDRVNNRIQVFNKDGTFVAEKRIKPASLADGSVWDIAFSHDPAQQFLYVADGKNMKIHIVERESLEALTSFGDGGRYPGQFYGVHNIATDSKGNIYTTETFEGKRLQKFVYKGMAPVSTKDRGTPWPAERLATAAQDSRARDPERERRTQETLAAPNPLEPSKSVWIEELTYMEVRDRIKSGDTIALIPTGGIEQNGPYLVTGKHNVMLETACPAVAVELGNALCAPIVPFVPEGNIEPPSGHMRYPGTISVRDSTFHALLEDIANSLKQHGFTDIVLIGDSGGNQRGLAAAAEALNRRWIDSGVTAHYIGEFYDPAWKEAIDYAQTELGVTEPRNDGHHDDIYVTAAMMVTDPASVRYEQRVEAGLASINGVDITPLEKTTELGRKLIEFRAKIAADAIRAAVNGK